MKNLSNDWGELYFPVLQNGCRPGSTHSVGQKERVCCDFFIFTRSVSGDKSEAWIELTGPGGAKDFITTKLGR